MGWAGRDEQTGSRGGFFWALSFYIILTQTLCAHDTLQDRKQRSSALWFDVCMTDEHFRDDSKTRELKLLDSMSCMLS